MSQSSSVFSPFSSLMCLFSAFPSLTRTNPVCLESRVTNGVDNPCSSTLPRDAPFHSTLSFRVNCCTEWEMWHAIPEHSSVKPHSCHTYALLQYISSSRGHDSASPVTTAWILIIISTALCILHANHNRSKADWKTMRAQFRTKETYPCVADRVFAETGRNVCFVFIQCCVFFNYNLTHIKQSLSCSHTNTQKEKSM